MPARILLAILLCCSPALCAAPPDVPALLAEHAGNIGKLVAVSRPVLLGKRKSDGRSCVRIVKAGVADKPTRETIGRISIPDGGIGTRYIAVFMGRKVTGPLSDFNWHQKTLAPWLVQWVKRNDTPNRIVPVASNRADAMAVGILGWQDIPADLAVPAFAPGDTWPEHCLAQLCAALKARDQKTSAHWVLEFAGAMRALADLHRWADFLWRNQLFALSFQKANGELFAAMDKTYAGKYKANAHIGRFPAGEWTLYGGDNYLEIERQAERLFTVPEEWRNSAPTDAKAYPLPPDTRKLFLALAPSLGAANRATWLRLPQRPYDRSYLACQLWRAQAGGGAGAMPSVLKRLNVTCGKATAAQMLDVLPYRAGAWFSGIEWPDRYDPRLLKTSATMTGDSRTRLESAWKFTNTTYGGKKNYKGLVLTLRAALDTGKMDCIRATDMIGALYRNSGQPGFRTVRMCRVSHGGAGHTVAAAVVQNGGKSSIAIMDGLVAGGGRKTWPSSYFRSKGTWSVELCARGLDSYIFLEGYIIQGSNAGTQVKAPCPWLPGYEKPEIKKVLTPK